MISPGTKLGIMPLSSLPTLLSLRECSPIREFVEIRDIPDAALKRMLFIESLQDFLCRGELQGDITVYYTISLMDLIRRGQHAEKFHPTEDHPYPEELHLNDSFVAFPVYDSARQMVALHCRRMSDRSERRRYLTVELIADTANRTGLGRDLLQEDTVVFVCEGALDSLLLPNAVSSMGYGNVPALLEDMLREYGPSLDPLIVLDNEITAPVVAIRRHCLSRGYRVVMWPSDFPAKDLQEFVALCGMGPEQLAEYLLSHARRKEDLGIFYHLEFLRLLFLLFRSGVSHYADRLQHYLQNPAEILPMLRRKVNGENKIWHSMWDKDKA